MRSTVLYSVQNTSRFFITILKNKKIHIKVLGRQSRATVSLNNSRRFVNSLYYDYNNELISIHLQYYTVGYIYIK